MTARIRTQAHIDEGVAAVSALCPHMAMMVAAIDAPIPMRLRKGGFETLLHAIVGQQVSVASAAAIWERLQAAVDPLEPAVLLRKRDETLQKAGLSRPKVRYVKALARALEDGDLDLKALARMGDDEAITALTAVPGIGQWTAEIYLLSCLGRWDVFPAGDIALQNMWVEVAGLDARPGTREMAEIALRWSPYRAIAARVLWTYLRHTRMMAGKNKSEVFPV